MSVNLLQSAYKTSLSKEEKAKNAEKMAEVLHSKATKEKFKLLDILEKIGEYKRYIEEAESEEEKKADMKKLKELQASYAPQLKKYQSARKSYGQVVSRHNLHYDESLEDFRDV